MLKFAVYVEKTDSDPDYNALQKYSAPIFKKNYKNNQCSLRLKHEFVIFFFLTEYVKVNQNLIPKFINKITLDSGVL